MLGQTSYFECWPGSFALLPTSLMRIFHRCHWEFRWTCAACRLQISMPSHVGQTAILFRYCPWYRMRLSNKKREKINHDWRDFLRHKKVQAVEKTRLVMLDDLWHFFPTAIAAFIHMFQNNQSWCYLLTNFRGFIRWQCVVFRRNKGLLEWASWN